MLRPFTAHQMDWVTEYFEAPGVEPAVANSSALWIDDHLKLVEERVMTVPLVTG